MKLRRGTKIEVEKLGHIKDSFVELGDFTVFVGPQGAGKTIMLETIKLIADGSVIKKDLKNRGYSVNDVDSTLKLYYGRGISSTIKDSVVKVNNDIVSFKFKSSKRKDQAVFYIPAQRVITMSDGWPMAFKNFVVDAPYVVKKFSDDLLYLMNQGLGKGETPIFPQKGRFKKELRDVLMHSIFWNSKLILGKEELKRRLELKFESRNEEISIPFMLWSAGQREFVPLLLGLYYLMPSGKTSKRKDIDWLIVEEPEMGLHPKGIAAVILILFELLRRGYKILISTHSQAVLGILWMLSYIKKAYRKFGPEFDYRQFLKKYFGVRGYGIDNIWDDVILREFKVYFFDINAKDNSVIVKDISNLDVVDTDEFSEWGGLIEYSSKSIEIVSDIISLLGEDDE